MSKADQKFQLSKRAETVLGELIRRYIDDGVPVGSRTLAREIRLQLSPATIRNVMADLEEYGLIESPHTSAGRVPTDSGYRLFINSMLKVRPLDTRAVHEIEERMTATSDPKQLFTGASELLSQITSFAGIVSLPGSEHCRFRQIEFLPLSNRRVLAILVTEDGQVQNRVLDVGREYGQRELQKAANFFNAEYSARSLFEVKQELLRRMERDSASMHELMRTAVTMAGKLLNDEDVGAEEVLVSGEDNLINVPDFFELEKLRQLFDTFHMKQVLLDLLQKSIHSSGVNIFIGEESGYKMLKDCSVITAPYAIDSERVGVLGVIGPTRMAYDEVISVVDVTARLLGGALSSASH